MFKIGNGTAWSFTNGKWEDGENGIIRPSGAPKDYADEGLQGYHFAFSSKKAYRNLEASFEILQTGHSDIGLIFRAKNAADFYVLHFPCCGQANRAQHFWVALSRMDPNGYLRILNRQMVNRVNSMNNIWHSVKVTVNAEKIQVQIDGRGWYEFAGLDDGEGFVGVMSFNRPQLKNLEIKGEFVKGFIWNDQVLQPKNWFYPCPADEYGKWQMPLNLLRVADDELLLYFSASEGFSSAASYYFIRSFDDGRTWSKPELWWTKSEIWEGQNRVLHVFPDGKLKCLIFGKKGCEIKVMETADRGHTWTEPQLAKTGAMPKGHSGLYAGPQTFVNLADGSVVMFAYGGIDTKIPDTEIYSWGALHCQAYSCRSTDGGYSWSDYINVDGAKDAEGKPVEGNLDFTEVCGVQAADGCIKALIRPVYSPWMWEARSKDGGLSWEQAVRGPFPGYATPNMLRTDAGCLVVAHRLPGMTLDMSPDDGETWSQAAMIDSAIWVMGSMIEVKPNVVLYVYWDSFEAKMRAQFIKVTAQGMAPAW
jgi:hypothetical protein